MSNVLHRVTKQYLPSVNDPDFPTADWIHSPDLSAVAGFASKHWTITGDVITLMSLSERNAVDAAEAAALLATVRASEKARLDNEKVLRAFMLVVLDEINLLRAAVIPALTARTQTQLVNAIKARVDTL